MKKHDFFLACIFFVGIFFICGIFTFAGIEGIKNGDIFNGIVTICFWVIFTMVPASVGIWGFCKK